MTILEKLLGASQKQKTERAWREADQATRKELRPVGEALRAISEAVRDCGVGLRPYVDKLQDEDARALAEINMYQELVFFFMHISSRQTWRCLSQSEAARFWNYAQPMMQKVAVNHYADCWPPDYKEQLMSNFTNRLNTAHDEYGACSQFDVPPLPELEASEIVSRLHKAVGLRLIGQIGPDQTPQTLFEIEQIVFRVFDKFDIRPILRRFKRDSANLLPYGE